MKLTTYITNNIEIIIFFSLVIIFILCILNRNWKTLFNNQHGINRLDAIIYISLYNPNNTSNILDNTDLFMKELKKLNTNMKKVIRLTENDLRRIVLRVIREQEEMDQEELDFALHFTKFIF